VLFVTGNYSGILSRLHRRFTELEIRRGFTTFQLMTILEEAHHSLIIVEHDPLLYEDAQEMTEYISQALKQASHEATVLLFSPEVDLFLEDLIKLAERSHWNIHCDTNNPELFELQASKEMLVEIYNVQISWVEDMI
jgi:hypothetical protein